MATSIGGIGCGPEEVTLRVVTGFIDESCPRNPAGGFPNPWTIRSIRIEILEWYSGTPGEPIYSECSEDIRGLEIVHPQNLINWYSERGYLAQDVPAGIPTRIHMVGFTNPDCTMQLRPLGPLICGYSEGVLSESTYSGGDPVRMTFTCPDFDDPPGDVYATCLSIGTMPEDEPEEGD